MNLRIAKKIYAVIGTSEETRYSEGKRCKAIDRFHRTKSVKENNAWFEYMLGEYSPAQRAKKCLALGNPVRAFRTLMQQDERDWDKTYNSIKLADFVASVRWENGG